MAEEVNHGILGIHGKPEELEIGLSYKGRPLRALTDEHRAQLMNYLRATGLKVGLLINFSHYPGVEHERFVI